MTEPQPLYTKKSLIAKLKDIKTRGWIPNARNGNHGGVGNTLEDLLGIKENNLPIPNAAEWELKTQRMGSASLVTLFHSEPSPRAVRFVPAMLLPKYGWPHKSAGDKYPQSEMSFRQTISANRRSDRGFTVIVDRKSRRLLISFDALAVDTKHAAWLRTVKDRAGIGELGPQPYWGFDDLEHDAGAKLHNTFFIQAEIKRQRGAELYHYAHGTMLKQFSLEGLLKGLEDGCVFVDFDARTGHNHGTKFRARTNTFPDLYAEKIVVL